MLELNIIKIKRKIDLNSKFFLLIHRITALKRLIKKLCRFIQIYTNFYLDELETIKIQIYE